MKLAFFSGDLCHSNKHAHDMFMRCFRDIRVILPKLNVTQVSVSRGGKVSASLVSESSIYDPNDIARACINAPKLPACCIPVLPNHGLDRYVYAEFNTLITDTIGWPSWLEYKNILEHGGFRIELRSHNTTPPTMQQAIDLWTTIEQRFHSNSSIGISQSTNTTTECSSPGDTISLGSAHQPILLPLSKQIYLYDCVNTYRDTLSKEWRKQLCIKIYAIRWMVDRQELIYDMCV